MCGAGGLTPFNFIVPIVLNGFGAVPATGVMAGDYTLPDGFQVRGWTIMADQAGDIEFDIWAKDFSIGNPPTVADSICGGNYPALVGAAEAQADFSALTGWTTRFAANTRLRWNLRSIATITFFTLQLQCRKLI